ncbi:MAG: alpha/beta fold hydrolase [Verrucomicrobiota bacterium]|jgi:pimeloyl-ACP methyl ester carboxylesterase
MRKCVQFKIDGQWLRGVCHEPPGASGNPEPGRTGVLYGNPGWLPRSGRGDLAVRLADAQAQDGYWAFRFDMPGLGDSDGHSPTDPMLLLHRIQVGDHGPFVCSLARELKKCYGLENIILGGHCGGAMSAIYAALLDNNNVVSGLILMDLVFWAVPRAVLADGAQSQSAASLRNSFARARRLVRRWILEAPGGDKVQALYQRGVRATERFRGLEIPANSNSKLLEAWRRVMDKRLPTLVISAHQPGAETAFDYLAYLKVDRQPSITSVAIEGTTHSFLEGNGGEAVATHCGNWLREHFPARSFADSKKG